MERKRIRCLEEAYYSLRSSLLHKDMAQSWNTLFWWTSTRARYQWNMDVSQEYKTIAQQLFDNDCKDIEHLIKKKSQLDEHTCRCAQHSLCYGNFQEEKEYIFQIASK